MNKTTSFSQLLKKAERKNRNALMHKAFIANRIAKTVHGNSRACSYNVKTRALRALINKFPGEVEFQNDEASPEMVIVSVSRTRFGLHAPRVLVQE